MASKFPDVRIFQAALENSEEELIDLAGVEIPWSRPTAGMEYRIRSYKSAKMGYLLHSCFISRMMSNLFFVFLDDKLLAK